jgi:hypothetical protein
MTWPDVEGGIRAYLRADAGVTALVAQRVFFGVPRRGALFPLVAIQRIGGGDDPGEAPLDRALLQVDCWGAFSDEAKHIRPNKAGAFALAAAVRDALSAIRGATAIGDSAIAYGANVVGVQWLPELDDRPRYSLTVDVTARALVA